jgi:membrane protein
MSVKSAKTLIRQLLINFSQDRIASQSAALAYYMVFSLTPIIIICISIVGVFFGEEAARGKILAEIGGLIGNETALQIQQIIEEANKPQASSARIFGFIVLLFSASGFFSELQAGLNLIWGVKAPNKGWLSIIKDRFLSFAIVLGVAFLLLVSLIISAFLATLGTFISHFMNTSLLNDLIISDLISLGMTTLLFAMMFKVLPDVEIKWRDVWEGALFTAVLFALGKMVIGFYLSQVQVASVFGAAGSFIIILVWVYYSAQIFFIGAEITKIFSTNKGKKIIPMRDAVIIKKQTTKPN